MNIALTIEDHHTCSDDLDHEDLVRFEGTIRHLCGLFISVVDQKVYLIHQIAKGFLLAKPEICSGVRKYSIESAAAELIITKTYITYLLFADFGSKMDIGWKVGATWNEKVSVIEKRTDKFHYLSYAVSQ
jgi:hypothetical protein